MTISRRRRSHLTLRSSYISITKISVASLFYTFEIGYHPRSRIEKIFQVTPMMSAILTVFDLDFHRWIEAIYRATYSSDLPAKITTAFEIKLVRIESRSPAIALHPKLLDIGATIGN